MAQGLFIIVTLKSDSVIFVGALNVPQLSLFGREEL